MQNPFDSFADNIRGLINTVMDLKTDPDLLSEAVNRMADAVIPKDVAAAKMMHAQYAFIPLHTGVDEFMSPDDYNRYYWPPLRRLIDSLLKEDITPMIFCEGNYYTRLETLKDVPKGQVVYFFEKQDMKKAKEILGRYCLYRRKSGHRTSDARHTRSSHRRDEAAFGHLRSRRRVYHVQLHFS